MNSTSPAKTEAPLPPPLMLRKLINGMWQTQAVCVAAKLKIADCLKDGPRTTKDLAQAVNAHEPSLFRLLRALASLGVFEETSPRTFGLTPIAACLRSDVPGSMYDFVIYIGSSWHWKAWESFVHSVKTGETAMKKTYDAELFDYFLDHPEDSKVFDRAMTSSSGPVADAIAKGYDFSTIETLVDIGGGHGRLLSAVLSRYPSMKGILFDLPSVVEEVPTAVRGKCTIVAGDFFKEIPEAADGYIMKHIIHDWDDEKSLKILKNIRKAIGEKNSKLLVVEHVIPQGNEPSMGKLMDLQMLAIASGQERTEEEYRALFASAGFKLTRIMTTESPLCVIEGIPE